MNLRREGIAKDLIRTIQSQRKEIACEYTDRIEVGIVSHDPEVDSTLDAHREMICSRNARRPFGPWPQSISVDPVDTEYGQVFVKKVQG